MLRIRRLELSDIGFAMRMVEAAGWNQLPADWERLIRVGPQGCFLAEWDGQPAGTATATAYGTDCAWIGMVLVDPARRKLGIGGALIRHCLEHLEAAGVRSVKLDATDQGRPVYLKQGFVDEYGTLRHAGELRLRGYRQERYRTEPLAADHYAAVRAMDRIAFGADRWRLLETLSQAQPALALAALEGARLAGYGFARPGRLSGYIGPIVAGEMDAAKTLAAELASRLPQKSVLLDTTALDAGWCDWLAASGLAVQRRLTRMYRGKNESPGTTGLVHALSAFETG